MLESIGIGIVQAAEAPPRDYGSDSKPAVFALLAATSRAFDSKSLARQRKAVERAAGAVGMAIDAYVVEVAPVPIERSWCVAFRDLLELARAGGLGVVLIDDVRRFAPDRDDAILAAMLLSERGVRVVEANASCDRRAHDFASDASPGSPRCGERRVIAVCEGGEC